MSKKNQPASKNGLIEFPQRPIPSQVIDTPMMHFAEADVMRCYSGGACSLWSGDAGVGKTTTARWIVERANQAYRNGAENAFRAVYYESGHSTGYKDTMMAILGLSAAVGRAAPAKALWRGRPPEDVASMVAGQLAPRDIGIVFIDEAQRLSSRAIDGLMQVFNAGNAPGGHPFTIVLIGLGDLASRVRKKATLSRRISSFVNFKEFTVDDFARLMRTRPGLSHLRMSNAEDRTFVETCHAEWKGNPGEFWPILLRAEEAAVRANRTLELTTVLGVRKYSKMVEDEIRRGEARGFLPNRRSKDAAERAA